MNKKLITLASGSLLLLPSVILAAIPNPETPQVMPWLNIMQIINAILRFLWPVFIGFAVIMLIVAAFYFITAQGDAEGVAKARQFVIWAIVGIAVGVLAFSIPYVVQNAICAGNVC